MRISPTLPPSRVGHRAPVAPLPPPTAALVRGVAQFVGIAASAWALWGPRRSAGRTLRTAHAPPLDHADAVRVLSVERT